ncbi:MAG: ABC transporter permease, partial [Balneolaceae bacterium]
LLYQYATNYDSFYKEGDRIYRVIDRVHTSEGSEVNTAMTPWEWGPALKREFPGVDNYVRFLIRGKSITYQNDAFNIAVSYVDSTFFNVFKLPLEQGDPQQALSGTNKVVISPDIARMLFGNENPMGKVIQIEKDSYEVTGVLKKLPPNSSIGYDMLVPASNIGAKDMASINNWEKHDIYTYLLLKKNIQAASIEHRLSSFTKRKIGNQAGKDYAPQLQPLTEMYLNTGLQGEHGDTLNPAYLYIFLSIGFLILLISCINFINISTARASGRNREVGIRKVIGASKGQLVFQYLLEVALITLASLVIAVILVEWTLPLFNALTGEWKVRINYSENLFFWGSTAGIFIFVTLVAGAYPAFYLTDFHPARIFRSKSSGSTRSWLRSGLVVTQFSLAVFLLFTSLVVNKQIEYLRQKDLGFNQQNLIRMYMWEGVNNQKAQAYGDQLLRNPQIRQVALTSDGPVSDGTMVKYIIPEKSTGDQKILNTLYVDSRFVPLMGLKMLKGRNFNANRASDSTSAVIINQTAVTQFGWKGEDPTGKVLRIKSENGTSREVSVIGVINDYNYQSLNQPIKPLVLQYRPSKFSNLLIRVQSPDPDKINAYIHKTWKEYFPGHFFFFYYVSDLVFESYTTEAVISQLLNMLTWLTIFIAGLGLLGLASYTILQRTKEIGIRKVLGASASEIIGMFSKEFLQFVLLGIIVGLPMAWYAVNQWLNSFAYHAEVHVTTFLIVVSVTLAAGWLTIAYQSIRAALANPVDSLRNE